ncbi:MAG: DUF294 nucleotidyltransferase-like domain-containing protein [Reinekea sp.]
MNNTARNDLKDVLDFLDEAIPFSALTEQQQLNLARKLEIEYFPERAKQRIPIDECIYLIRTGAFEIVDDNNRLVDRLGEGECFGVSTLLHDNPDQLRVYAIEDSLVYRLPKSEFLSLLEEEKSLRLFFEKLVNYRAHQFFTLDTGRQSDIQHTQPVSSLIQNKLVYCSVQSSIREAAEIMRENKVSCLLLVEKKCLQGIVTDRDFRNRVVADALDVDRPITDIATMNTTTIVHDAPILEAQMLMSNIGIHHLPVIQDQQPIGVITATDIVRAHSVSLVHFVDRIFREKSAVRVAQLQSQVPSLFDYWIQADVSAEEIGESFAVIGDAFVRKAIELAKETHGEPPMRFAWLAFGSQARKEQSFASDQDNGLILEREPDEAEAAFFAAFSDTVCQLLDQFGYMLCPGDIMARNASWRKTRVGWQQVFGDWIDTPNPEALLNASIFFDMRIVYGDSTWLDEIKQVLLVQLEKADLFFMQMTRNALRAKPPLGFFRSFIVNESGEHEHELDIKHHGLALINDLARIIALAEGNLSASTSDRLLSASDQYLQKPLRESLYEAWLLLGELKIENQSRQIKSKRPRSNYINPDELSPLRRAHLKNAFKAIARAQKALAQHYLRAANV